MIYEIGETVYFNYDNTNYNGEILDVDYEERTYLIYATNTDNKDDDIQDWFTEEEVQ